MKPSVSFTVELRETSGCTASASGLIDCLQIPATEAASEGGSAFDLRYQEIPDSFWRGLADIDAGRHVDLDVALDEPAEDAEI